MLPRSERFADTRRNRFAGNPLLRHRDAREHRRASSRLLADLWRDVRLDRRFALPRLYALAGKRNVYPAAHSQHTDAMHCERFQSDPQISGHARLYAAAHRALSDPTKVACYPTRADAAREREIVMKPGAFFAAVHPDWTPAQVQAAAEAYVAPYSPVVLHMIPNTDADGWARVYCNPRGFTSCMAKGWQADDPEHPVRFYAHPANDLALAYITHDGKPRGPVTARTIVNRKKKLYVRIYGDARITTALDVAGYTHDPDGALNGQTCNALTDCDDRLIAPYIDVSHKRISWDGSSDTCTIARSGCYVAEHQDGFAPHEDDDDEDDRQTCECCGDPTDDDEMNYSEHHEIGICDYCVRNNYTRGVIVDADGNEDIVRDDEVVTLAGQHYLDDAEVIEAHGFVLDEDGDWQDADECHFIHARDAYVHADYCTRLDVPHTNRYGNVDNYAHDDDVTRITLRDGRTLNVHDDDADDLLAADDAAHEARTARRAAAIRAAAARNHNRRTRRARINARRAAR